MAGHAPPTACRVHSCTFQGARRRHVVAKPRHGRSCQHTDVRAWRCRRVALNTWAASAPGCPHDHRGRVCTRARGRTRMCVCVCARARARMRFLAATAWLGRGSACKNAHMCHPSQNGTKDTRSYALVDSRRKSAYASTGAAPNVAQRAPLPRLGFGLLRSQACETARVLAMWFEFSTGMRS